MTKTDLCNIAIGHIGVAALIEDIDSARDPNAKACRQYVDISIETTLKAFPWPFATKVLKLSLIENLNKDYFQWGFRYRYPSDCLQSRKILSDIRNDNRQSLVPYRIFADGIYCDRENAVLEYTLKISNVGDFKSDFLLAQSFLLASLIAPLITHGDEFDNGKKAFEKYNYYIAIAQSTSLNEEQGEDVPDAELVRGRI